MLIKKERTHKAHKPVHVEMVDHGSLAHYLAVEGYSTNDVRTPFGDTSSRTVSNESLEDARAGIASVVRCAMYNYKKQNMK